MRDIESVVKGREGVESVRSDRYLMPSESRRLIDSSLPPLSF